MDAYLSKPIQPKDLLPTIDRLATASDVDGRKDQAESRHSIQHDDAVGNHAAPAAALLPAALAGQVESLDLPSLLARVEGDWDLLNEMCELFLQSSPPLLAEIEAGIARRDSGTVERASHALKGAMQNMGALPAARAAAGLEEIGRMDDLGRAKESLTTLKQEFERLVTAISQQSIGDRS
ncbi:MAG: Hpt domain-containing protein, partial [Pirellulales bacterium]